MSRNAPSGDIPEHWLTRATRVLLDWTMERRSNVHTYEPGDAMSRFLLVVAVMAGLLTSCAGKDESGCGPISAQYSRAIQRGLLTPADRPIAFFTAPSAIPGTWYVAASVGGVSSAWVTDRDPRGDVIGHVLAANRAAQRLSSVDFNMPVSFSTLVQAAGHPDGVRRAEACVASGGDR